MAWIYILQCSDGSYYVGSTPDIERRIAEHRLGQGGAYTRKRLPVKLVYSCEMPSVEETFFLERRIKGWWRQKKEALIKGDYAELVRLSRTSKPTT